MPSAASVTGRREAQVRRVQRSLERELPACQFDDQVVEYLANTLDSDEPLSEDTLVTEWSPFLFSAGACADDDEALVVCRGLLARLKTEDGTVSTAASDADAAAGGAQASAQTRPGPGGGLATADAAAECIGGELEEWLEKLRLSQYARQAREWCEQMGAADLQEVMEHWQDFVEGMKFKPLEKKRVEKDVASSPPPKAAGAAAAAPSSPSHAAHAAPAHAAASSSRAPHGHRRPGTFGPADDPERYELLEEIGTGATAIVHRCSRGNEVFAVKTISLAKLRLQRDFKKISDKLHREVNILFNLRHQRIVTLYDVVEDEHVALHLVMELVDGGELFEKIVELGCFDERVARYVFLQVAEGLRYIHGKDIVHRDLKPENILVDAKASRGDLIEVKLSDFGHSKLINDGYSTALTRVGTPQYWAPEVSDPRKAALGYDQTVDLWSLGVVLYVMLVGSYPFDGVGASMDDQIKRAQLSFRSQTGVKHLSPQAKDLISSLIKVNPKDRLPLEKCLQHPWVTTGAIGRVINACSDDASRAVEVRIPMPEQPSKETVQGLRQDIVKWQTKFCFAANVKHQELVVNYGDSKRLDRVKMETAQNELQAMLDYYFPEASASGGSGGSPSSRPSSRPSSSGGSGGSGGGYPAAAARGKASALPTVQEEKTSSAALATRGTSFRLLSHTLRVTEEDGAGLELTAEVGGMRVTDVFEKPGQPGLQRHDLITKINEVPLRGGLSKVEEVFSAHFGNGALLAVKRHK